MKKEERPRHNNGALGEQIAAEKLRQAGYVIVDCNYRTRFGEIDIIARDKQYIVFVEVKTRNADALYHPLEAITPAKQRKIILTAQDYLQKNPTKLQPRFDAVAVIMEKDAVQSIEHLLNAFMI